jgi:hypothetical protein
VTLAGRRWSRSSTCRTRKSGEGNDVGVSAGAGSIVCADAVVVCGARIQTGDAKVRDISNIEILVPRYVIVDRALLRDIDIEPVTASIAYGVPICGEAAASSVRGRGRDRRGGG